jgi:hypothetical protein
VSGSALRREWWRPIEAAKAVEASLPHTRCLALLRSGTASEGTGDGVAGGIDPQTARDPGGRNGRRGRGVCERGAARALERGREPGTRRRSARGHESRPAGELERGPNARLILALLTSAWHPRSGVEVCLELWSLLLYNRLAPRDPAAISAPQIAAISVRPRPALLFESFVAPT